MNARELLAQATARPWTANSFTEGGDFYTQVRAGKQATWVAEPLPESIVVNGEGCYADEMEAANAELIARAVNEFEALLDVEAMLRVRHQVDPPGCDCRWCNALARLDGIRGQHHGDTT